MGFQGIEILNLERAGLLKPYPPLYNLELHEKVNGEWVHSETIIWNASYSLCKGMKLQKETTKSYLEFYKITKN